MVAVLDGADRTLAKLEKLCCEPGRSPAMAEVADDLAAVRSAVGVFDGDASQADSIVERLEQAGSRIGRLQVGCCAPARMPLYADLLAALTDLQRCTNAGAGRAH